WLVVSVVHFPPQSGSPTWEIIDRSCPCQIVNTRAMGKRMHGGDMNHAGTLAETNKGREWPTRLTVVLLFFFSSFICYMDRINISITILQMEEEFGWGAAHKGLVLSSFFWGYLITQLPGGWLAD